MLTCPPSRRDRGSGSAFDASDGAGPWGLCRGEATRGHRGSRPQLRGPAPWPQLPPALAPSTWTGRPPLVSRVTGSSAARAASPALWALGTGSAQVRARSRWACGRSDRPTFPLPCIPDSRLQPQIPAALEAGCTLGAGTQLRNSRSPGLSQPEPGARGAWRETRPLPRQTARRP